MAQTFRTKFFKLRTFTLFKFDTPFAGVTTELLIKLGTDSAKVLNNLGQVITGISTHQSVRSYPLKYYWPPPPPQGFFAASGPDPVLSQYGFVGYPPTEYQVIAHDATTNPPAHPRLTWNVPDVNLGYPRLGGSTQDGGTQAQDLVYWFAQSNDINSAAPVYVYGVSSESNPKYVYVPRHNYVFASAPEVPGEIGPRPPGDTVMVLNVAGGGSLGSYVGGAVLYFNPDTSSYSTILFDGFSINDITGFSVYRKVGAAPPPLPAPQTIFTTPEGTIEGTLIANLPASARSFDDDLLPTTGSPWIEYRIIGHTIEFDYPNNDVHISATTSRQFWTTPFGLTGPSVAAGAVAARVIFDGSVIVSGSFTGDNNFPDPTPTGTHLANLGSQGQDFFIAKYLPTGVLQWAKQFGNAQDCACSAMAVDSVGNVIIVGQFGGQIDFGGLGNSADKMTSLETQSMFIAKYSTSSGTRPVLIWKFQFLGAQNCSGVAVDNADNIIITGGYGNYGTTVNFGGGPLPNTPTNSGGFRVYVAKFNSDGVYQWANGYGTAGYCVGYAVAVDRSVPGTNDVAVTGQYQNGINFGGSTFTNTPTVNGLSDVFAVRLAGSNGAHRWSWGTHGAGHSAGKAVAFAPNGNVTITGVIQGQVDFGAGAVGGGSSDYMCFLATWGPTGTYQSGLQLTIPAVYGSQGAGVVYDSNGNLVITGYGTGLFYTLPHLGGGVSNLFIIKYNSSNAYQGGYVIGGTGNAGSSVSVDSTNNILATGSFGSVLDFGSGPSGSYGAMASPGSGCGFVAKFPPTLPA